MINSFSSGLSEETRSLCESSSESSETGFRKKQFCFKCETLNRGSVGAKLQVPMCTMCTVTMRATPGVAVQST
jgi:hypothetical protein